MEKKIIDKNNYIKCRYNIICLQHIMYNGPKLIRQKKQIF